MNKSYAKPELDVELFDVEDVITASSTTTDPNVGEIPSGPEIEEM